MSSGKKRVLFLGEGSLDGPARYLAAILTHARIDFDHLQDQKPISPRVMKNHYDAFILSDYRHACFSKTTEAWLDEQVRSGAGFLMIGGWASFTGLVGRYAGTKLESLLPVRCIPGDDRINRSALVCRSRRSSSGIQAFPIMASEMTTPPIICGYHRVQPKPETQVVLMLRDLRFKKERPTLGPSHPLLVLGRAGEGRTAAFLTDCAPHWAGGLVDWGPKRITVQLSSDHAVEVGDYYLKFFARLVRWGMGNLC